MFVCCINSRRHIFLSVKIRCEIFCVYWNNLNAYWIKILISLSWQIHWQIFRASVIGQLGVLSSLRFLYSLVVAEYFACHVFDARGTSFLLSFLELFDRILQFICNLKRLFDIFLNFMIIYLPCSFFNCLESH